MNSQWPAVPWGSWDPERKCLAHTPAVHTSVLGFLEFPPSQCSIASWVIMNIDDPSSPPQQKAFVHVLIYLSHLRLGWLFSYYYFCLLLCLCSPFCSLLGKADLWGLCQGSPLHADFQLGLASGEHRPEIGGEEGSQERVCIPLLPPCCGYLGLAPSLIPGCRSCQGGPPTGLPGFQ